MSVSSQIFFGYYIKAKCSTVPQHDVVMACSNSASHDLPNPTPKFCPECGGKVVETNVAWDMVRSLCGIQWEGADYDWIKSLSKENIEWLNENFSVHDSAYIAGEEGYDYIMCGKYESIDGLDTGINPISVVDLTTPPTPEDIIRLRLLMRYETTELLFGALVSVSE